MNYEYFTNEELTCKCGCGRQWMDDTFMRKLITLRKAAKFPFNLTSAYRCEYHNAMVSSTGRDGPHTTGRAVDIALFGREALFVISNAALHGMSGIGIKQTGSYTGRFIHLDDLTNAARQPRPWVWTY